MGTVSGGQIFKVGNECCMRESEDCEGLDAKS